MKSDKPVDSYLEAQRNRKDAEAVTSIDELPQERRDWLRAT